MHALSTIQHAYTQAAPLQPTYIRICARKYKNEVGFPCHDRRSMILGLPYTGNVLTRPFSCILNSIRAQFRAMEKRRKHSTWEQSYSGEITSYWVYVPLSLRFKHSVHPTSSFLIVERTSLPLFYELAFGGGLKWWRPNWNELGFLVSNRADTEVCNFSLMLIIINRNTNFPSYRCHANIWLLSMGMFVMFIDGLCYLMC